MPPAGRRSARRQAVFILYQQDLLGLTPQAALLRDPSAEPGPYARALVLGVGSHVEEIDRRLAPHLSNWDLKRLGALERSILRLAAYELLWQDEDEVPAPVAIDEAGALVNGVLGGLKTEVDDPR